MLPNVFEWIILAIALVLIVVLMNMFPICNWLAKKTLKQDDNSEKNN